EKGCPRCSPRGTRCLSPDCYQRCTHNCLLGVLRAALRIVRPTSPREHHWQRQSRVGPEEQEGGFFGGTLLGHRTNSFQPQQESCTSLPFRLGVCSPLERPLLRRPRSGRTDQMRLPFLGIPKRR